jgi:superoxide dismutase, Cu-Zn family
MKEAIAVFQGTIQGSVHFSQSRAGERTVIQGHLVGLKPNAKCGFHVHEFGDLTDTKDLLTLGAHYNPHHAPHGPRQASEKMRHVGDLGNISADAKGVACFKFYDHLIKLSGRHSILGRSLVVHVGRDDLGRGNAPDSHTTGHSGARMAAAVIGIKHTGALSQQAHAQCSA